MKRLIPLILVLGLSGCATTSSPEDSIAAACQAYASALTTLAMERRAGNLSDKQVATVESIRAVANPICQDGEWTTPAAGLATIENALLQLQEMN